MGQVLMADMAAKLISAYSGTPLSSAITAAATAAKEAAIKQNVQANTSPISSNSASPVVGLQSIVSGITGVKTQNQQNNSVNTQVYEAAAKNYIAQRALGTSYSNLSPDGQQKANQLYQNSIYRGYVDAERRGQSTVESRNQYETLTGHNANAPIETINPTVAAEIAKSSTTTQTKIPGSLGFYLNKVDAAKNNRLFVKTSQGSRPLTADDLVKIMPSPSYQPSAITPVGYYLGKIQAYREGRLQISENGGPARPLTNSDLSRFKTSALPSAPAKAEGVELGRFVLGISTGGKISMPEDTEKGFRNIESSRKYAQEKFVKPVSDVVVPFSESYGPGVKAVTETTKDVYGFGVDIASQFIAPPLELAKTTVSYIQAPKPGKIAEAKAELAETTAQVGVIGAFGVAEKALAYGAGSSAVKQAASKEFVPAVVSVDVGLREFKETKDIPKSLLAAGEAYVATHAFSAAGTLTAEKVAKSLPDVKVQAIDRGITAKVGESYAGAKITQEGLIFAKGSKGKLDYAIGLEFDKPDPTSSAKTAKDWVDMFRQKESPIVTPAYAPVKDDIGYIVTPKSSIKDYETTRDITRRPGEIKVREDKPSRPGDLTDLGGFGDIFEKPSKPNDIDIFEKDKPPKPSDPDDPFKSEKKPFEPDEPKPPDKGGDGLGFPPILGGLPFSGGGFGGGGFGAGKVNKTPGKLRDLLSIELGRGAPSFKTPKEIKTQKKERMARSKTLFDIREPVRGRKR